MATLKEDQKLTADVVRRAITDPQFKRRLLKDPKATVQELRGDKVDECIEVRVVENTYTVRHIVLPYVGSDFTGGAQLTDEQIITMCHNGTDFRPTLG